MTPISRVLDQSTQIQNNRLALTTVFNDKIEL